jgi:hypothetical protein
MKHPKVTERKLGREKAMGLADFETKSIEVDPRQTSKDMLDTLIHEWWHIEFPNDKEKRVAAKSKKLANFLWKHKVRILRK